MEKSWNFIIRFLWEPREKCDGFLNACLSAAAGRQVSMWRHRGHRLHRLVARVQTYSRAVGDDQERGTKDGRVK